MTGSNISHCDVARKAGAPSLDRRKRPYHPVKPTVAWAEFAVLCGRVGSFRDAIVLRQVHTLWRVGYDSKDISIAIGKSEPQVCGLIASAREMGQFVERTRAVRPALASLSSNSLGEPP